MLPFHTIITHPGGAHQDEFLACCVLLVAQPTPVPVLRREPVDADLADPATCVVDVGFRHEPAFNNYDHHQFDRDHPPICALSLVLQALGLYEDAREFHPWLAITELFDSRGPFVVAQHFGLERDDLSRLASPITGTLLRRFSASTRVAPGEPLWEIMQSIGNDIVETVRRLRERLAYLEPRVEFWPLELPGRTAEVFFLKRDESTPDEPSRGIDEFIDRRGKRASVVAVAYPDRRSGGYALARFRDAQELDFTRIATEPEVHFTHARGFVAKTGVATPERLRALLAQAVVPAN